MLAWQTLALFVCCCRLGCLQKVKLHLATCKLSESLLCAAAGWAVYDKLKLRRRKGEKWTQSSELTLGKDAPSDLIWCRLTCSAVSSLRVTCSSSSSGVNFGRGSCLSWQPM